MDTELKIMKAIHSGFLKAQGTETAAGYCHVISVLVMRRLNSVNFLNQPWLLCLGKHIKGNIETEHYWLEGTSRGGNEYCFIDITADQFGRDIPFISKSRPRSYNLETCNQDELSFILEASAINSWSGLVDQIVKDHA
ncbi:hypothetical protein OUY36_01660 [Stutzerimonas sp. R40042]|uniref:hypothetical protein n=1 Tax=Stutzerimonas TaxID=2901164 RepID=UPI002277B2DF|nr:hypothetical protein [Stutzerimonas sp. R40042]WAE62308.1 hypothetical protein OUY36_01660 [Stutzerimonas sp. R40042]